MALCTPPAPHYAGRGAPHSAGRDNAAGVECLAFKLNVAVLKRVFQRQPGFAHAVLIDDKLARFRAFLFVAN